MTGNVVNLADSGLQVPVEMQAPATTYLVFYLLFAIAMIPTVAWMAYDARRRRSAIPLAALGGGLIVGLVVPPIYNYLTLVWFPSNIPLPFVKAFGMNDPWFDALGYALFVGFGGYLLYLQFIDGQGARAVYTTFALWAVTDLVLELPFLAAGMYRYYGDQPFMIGGFPLHWVVMNGLVPIVSGTSMYFVAERWPSGRRGAALRVLVVPVVTGALLMIPIFPVATALHAEVPSAVRWFASVVAITICLCGVRLAAQLADREIAVAGRKRGLVRLMAGLPPSRVAARPER
jgi:hypothetical protein